MGAEAERELISAYQAATAGDAHAPPDLRRQVAALFQRERPNVLAACRRDVRDPQRAEELAQDTLLVAARRLHTFEGRARFRTWLLRIARNLCRNANRKAADLLTEDGVLDLGDRTRGVITAMVDDEREALINQAAAMLDEVEREVVRLRYVEQLSKDEISQRLGLPGTGARAVLQRVHRKLRKRMLEQLEAAGHRASTLFMV